MDARTLLLLIAAIELATGIGLLVAPATVSGLLLGEPLGAGVALVVGRVAGLALIAIGLVCWLERAGHRAGSPTSLLIGLLVYNAAVPVLLIHARWAHGVGGIGLWPAIGAHLVLAAWIVAIMRRPHTAR